MSSGWCVRAVAALWRGPTKPMARARASPPPPRACCLRARLRIAPVVGHQEVEVVLALRGVVHAPQAHRRQALGPVLAERRAAVHLRRRLEVHEVGEHGALLGEPLRRAGRFARTCRPGEVGGGCAGGAASRAVRGLRGLCPNPQDPLFFCAKVEARVEERPWNGSSSSCRPARSTGTRG